MNGILRPPGRRLRRRWLAAVSLMACLAAAYPAATAAGSTSASAGTAQVNCAPPRMTPAPEAHCPLVTERSAAGAIAGPELMTRSACWRAPVLTLARPGMPIALVAVPGNGY